MRIPGPWSRRNERRQAARLYRDVVEQARRPVFYVDFGVPDTPDGRFDMVSLHAALLLRRLHRERDRTAVLAQAVFDLMFADMDENLREMGVGDLGVGPRVKAMARGFYGRLDAYDRALGADGAAVAEALRRNVFRKCDPSDAAVERLADYVRLVAQRLDAAPLERVTAGQDLFPPPPDATAHSQGEPG